MAAPLRAYVEDAFSASDADACGEDFGEAQRLRDGAIRASTAAEGASTASTAGATRAREALTTYYRALCAIESRIPISPCEGHAEVEFAWFEAGRGPRASPAAVSARDVQYEKCAVLYNYAALWSRIGAWEFGSGSEDGIKRACAAFQASAGAFGMLGDLSERKLFEGSVTIDVSREYCDAMSKLQLAQAQECFYEKARQNAKTSAATMSKLAQQARLYYDESATAMSRLAGYLDDDVLTHVKLKGAQLGAMALRLAGKVVLDADETNVGQAIARARQATSLLAAAIQEARVVASDAGLERAKALLNDELLPELKSLERDNDCVYMERVPKVEDLPPLAAANLVKAIEPPAEEFSPVGVTLFQNIVPDSGTKALSRYTEMVDDLIRNETDTLALASDEARLALREMELPETLIALSTAVPLESDLNERVMAFRSSGGGNTLTKSLERVDELNRQCSGVVTTIRETLEVEAAEDASSRAMFGEAAWRRPPSASQNAELMRHLKRFEVDLEVATKSDVQLKGRVEGADGVLELLDEENMKHNAPTLKQPLALIEEDASVATDIQETLEMLESIGNERAGIEDSMRKTKAEDNVLPKLMAQSGESLDAFFDAEMKKYEQAKDNVMLNISKQADALSRLRSLHEKFVEIYDVESLRRDVQSHEHGIRHALSVVDDLRNGMEQGVRFYSGFLDAARRTLVDAQEYASTRKLEKEALAEELRNEKARADERAAHMANQMSQMHFHPPPPPPQGYYQQHPPQPYPSPQYGAQAAPPMPPHQYGYYQS